MLFGPLSKGTELPTKGERCVYLVYGPHYELLGVGSSPDESRRIGTKYELPFRVVGPVITGEFIDWETVGEEAFGKDYGKAGDYLNLVDGVPMPEHKDPLTKAQARAIPSHASKHLGHREEM
jgi:hypothetical protein